MKNIEEEFNKLNKKAHNDEEIYRNFQLFPEKMNFPTIFLTKEEIVEFNEECKKSGIDLKVVPISEYLNINNPKINHADPDSFMEMVSNSVIHLEEEEEEDEKCKEDKNSENSVGMFLKNELLNKKKNRDDDESMEYSKSSKEENNSSNKSDRSIYSSEINKNQLELNESQSENKDMNLNKKYNKSKKSIKSKTKNLDMNNYFYKIKETSTYRKNEDKRCREVIQEIEEKTKNLTENGLIQLSNAKKIRRIGNEFSTYELKKKNLNFLEDLLLDIKQNSEVFDKLDKDRNPTIRAKEQKEELLYKEKEKERERNRMKEENKKNINNINQDNVEKIEESSDEESEPSYDEDGSLE